MKYLYNIYSKIFHHLVYNPCIHIYQPEYETLAHSSVDLCGNWFHPTHSLFYVKVKSYTFLVLGKALKYYFTLP